MNGEQSDALTRLVSAPRSRRTTLASLLGVVVLKHAPDTTAKRKGKRKSAKRKGKPKNRRQGSCYPGSNCIPGQGKNNAGCDFSDSTLFRQHRAEGSQLRHTNFSGADLTGANFQGADLEGACLVGADLQGAVIDGSTKLKGAIFCKTRMPDGSLNDTGCDRGTRCCPICDAAHPCGQGEVCCGGRCVPGECCGTGEQSTCGDGELCCEGLCRAGVWANQTTFGSRGPGPDQFQFPQGVAVSSDERTLWVADTASQRISIWIKTGNTWTNQTTFGSGGPGPGQFSFPFSVAVADDERTVWVADSNNNRIAIWTESGGDWSPETTFGSEGNGPSEFGKQGKNRPCYSGKTCQLGPANDNSRCDFTESVRFFDLDVQGANLSQTNLTEAQLAGTNLRGVDLSGACLVGANLLNATTDDDTDFDDAILCRTLMPDGSIDDSGCDDGTPCCPTPEVCEEEPCVGCTDRFNDECSVIGFPAAFCCEPAICTPTLISPFYTRCQVACTSDAICQNVFGGNSHCIADLFFCPYIGPCCSKP